MGILLIQFDCFGHLIYNYFYSGCFATSANGMKISGSVNTADHFVGAVSELLDYKCFTCQ